jgi:hypothetical protein
MLPSPHLAKPARCGAPSFLGQQATTTGNRAPPRTPFLRVLLIRIRPAKKTSPTTPPDTPLPDAVASGKEPFIVIGAIAGG